MLAAATTPWHTIYVLFQFLQLLTNPSLRSSPCFGPSVSYVPAADVVPRLAVLDLLAGRPSLAQMSTSTLNLVITRVTRPWFHRFAHNCGYLFLLSVETNACDQCPHGFPATFSHMSLLPIMLFECFLNANTHQINLIYKVIVVIRQKAILFFIF